MSAHAHLSERQQVVFDFISKITDDNPQKKEFIVLDAPAGTGKTFLIHRLFERYGSEIHILAPTHKAKSLFPSHYGAQTIHRFFSASMEYDDAGKEIFVFKEPKIDKNVKLIVVDESSMISEDMISQFENMVRQVPILFTCDKAQLPPVGEDVSSIYEKATVEFTLTQNMRSAQSKFVDVVDRLRHNVFNQAKYRINYASLTKDYLAAAKDFKEGKSAVILTWTNKRRTEWNRRIRTHLFESQVLSKVYLDERLMFSGHRCYNNITYFSSTIIQAKQLEHVTIFLGYEPVTCGCSIVHLKNGTKVIGCRQCGIEPHREAGFNINFILLTDENNTPWYLPKEDIDARRIQSLLSHRRKFIMAQKSSVRRRDQLWAKYYDFKNTYIPDLDYIYALTTHKAQGSEWETVYVDFKNISWSHDIRDRLLYTACSRMRSSLTFIDMK